MKKLFSICTILLIILGFQVNSFAEEKSDAEFIAKLTFKVGTVKVKAKGESDFESAKLFMKLYQGDTVKTGEESNAEIKLGDDNKIRLAPETEFVIEKLNAKEKSSSLKLKTGKLWNKVKKGTNTNVSTPTAVAGVRGTEFIIYTDGERTVIFVIEGEVQFSSDEFKAEELVSANWYLSVSNSGVHFHEATPDEIRGMMSGIPIFIKSKYQGKDLRNELKDEIKRELDNLNIEREIYSDKRTNDFITGRTIKDIHGNVVRVEQILLRPDPYTVQIINLTKRADGLSYFDIKSVYSENLPENISDWGGFFSNDDAGLYESIREIKAGTRIQGAGDEIIWRGTYDPTTREMTDQFWLNGEKKEGDMDSLDMQQDPSELVSRGVLYLYDPETHILTDTIYIRAYIIDNNGNILTSKTFETSGSFFNIVENIAGELILTSDSFQYGDIDIVTTADIAIIIVQEIYQ